MAARNIRMNFVNGRGPIEIDGQEVKGVRGFTYTQKALEYGHLTLDVVVRGSDINGVAYVSIPDKTRNTLILLGWTPPAENV